ncbi:ABC transporter permease subunit [Candidatus Thorarchaeota archaeon]|nr:MAG: ABC transporter permease subunit [Candidatus Thorarchaeota archaeon]
MTKIALRDLLAKRVIQAIITIFIVLAIDFAIFHLLPGSIIDRLARNPNLSEAVQQQIIRQFGLDLPLSVQFFAFIANFLRGEFGISFFYGANFNIGTIISERLINTLVLMIPADIIAILLGIWIGKVGAWHRGKWRDAIGLLFSLVMYAIPGFWLGMILLLIFGYNLQIAPTNPYNFMRSFNTYMENGNILGFLGDAVAHLFLPILVLTLVIFGVFTLIMRNSLLDVLSEDYMLTAKAKGQSERAQLNNEAVPNARIPVSTVIAIQIGFSVVGALLIEIVFNYHGIGRLIWDAVVHRDYPIMQATFFMFTVVLVFTNLIADFIYYYLDPRIRVGGQVKITAKTRSGRFRDRINLSTIAIIALLALDLFAVVVTPRILIEMFLLTGLVVAIIQRRRVLGFLRSLINPYRLTNLRFTWRTRRIKMIDRFANVLFIMGFLWFSIVFILIIISVPWAGINTWSLSIYMIAIGMVIKLLGSIIERPQRVSSIFNQIIENRLGLLGLVIVIIFSAIALFGEVIIPYDAKAIGAGPAFMPPTSLPPLLGIVLTISLAILFFGLVLTLFFNRKNISETPAWIRKIGYGLLIVQSGAALMIASLLKENSLSQVGSLVIVIIGGFFVYKGVMLVRNINRPPIRELFPRLASFLVLMIGASILIYFTQLLMTYQPVNFFDFHLLGTDQLGHDLFSGIIIGARITLLIGLLAASISVVIGTAVGLISGYYGGRIDALLMRFTDIFFVIPAFVLMIIIAAVVGPSLTTMLIVIGIFSWATTARIIRGQVLSLKERGYIERVRSVGGSNFYIMTKHILPSVAPLIIVQTVLLVMNAIFFEISLDFVGLGDPGITSWGSLLYLAQNQGISLGMDWLIYAPGVAIIILLVGISFLGFGLDEVMNPRLRRR